MPKVNPEILIWARETAGFTVDEAANKLGVRDAYGMSAHDRLSALEKGEQEPSRTMLIKMSKKYRRPLLAFYISTPPRKGDRGQDFRTLPETYTLYDDSLIDAMLRDVLARQNMVRAALEDDDDVETLDFVGSSKISDGMLKTIEAIRDILKIDIQEYRSQSNPLNAFKMIRNKAESAGIFVLLKGDMGSYHTLIDVSIFRGFALADNIAPFIIINHNDSKPAWSFTLLHELVHLMLGQTGISGGSPEISIERFCNKVAGEFLLPSEEANQILIKNSHSLEDILNIISEFAISKNVSSSMVAYKLYLLKKIDYNVWNSLSEKLYDLWLKQQKENREKLRKTAGGPSYYVIRKQRLGISLIKLVNNLMLEGSLSTTKAGMVLGVKAKNVQRLFESALSPKPTMDSFSN